MTRYQQFSVRRVLEELFVLHSVNIGDLAVMMNLNSTFRCFRPRYRHHPQHQNAGWLCVGVASRAERMFSDKCYNDFSNSLWWWCLLSGGVMKWGVYYISLSFIVIPATTISESVQKPLSGVQTPLGGVQHHAVMWKYRALLNSTSVTVIRHSVTKQLFQ